MADMHNTIMAYFESKVRPDNLPMMLKRGGRSRLCNFFKDYGFNRGAEIGVNWGRYSERLCRANPENIELYCIDPWYSRVRPERAEKKVVRAKERLAPYNATIIRKKSMDALADFKDKSLDFVFIDGNHSFDFVCPDIIFWSQKVRKGGIIACHDYYAFRNGGVMKAVEAYTHCHKIDPWYTTYEVMPSAVWFKP